MMCDVGLPVMDVWTSHELVIRVPAGGLFGFTISGYSFTCIPLEWVVSDTGTMVRVRPPAWVVPEDVAGKNKWLGLAVRLRQLGIGDATVDFYSEDGQRPRVEVPSLEVLTAGGVSGGAFDTIGGELGCRGAIGDTAFSRFIDRPVGTWAPQHDAWGLEPADVSINARITESPYNPSSRTVMVWGATYTMNLVLDLVPAADIFSMRAADIPHDGWAAQAFRRPAIGVGAVLEYLMPWMMRSRAQGLPFRNVASESGEWNISQGDVGSRWTPAHGTPIVLYTKRDMIGRGFCMRSDGRDGGSSEQGGVPHAAKMRFSWDDSVARHVALSGNVSMADMLEVRVGTNQRYRVEMPLIDMTWRSVNATSVTSNVITQRMVRR